MPIIQAKKKSVRQSARHRVFNDKRKRAMRKNIKTVKALVANGKRDEAQALISKTYKSIDKAKKGGIIKSNTANRKKSLISRITKKPESKE